jgi:DNA-directed RNA polymerase specialized sigma24 family protein
VIEGGLLVDSQWESLDSQTPLFSALTKLSPQGQRAINLRFWENYTIEEISETLRMTWDQTDKLIEKSLLELRERLTQTDAPSKLLEAS